MAVTVASTYQMSTEKEMAGHLPANVETVRIGTRGSKLALVQANEVRDRLLAAHGDRLKAVEVQVISTAGDRSQAANRPLSEIGGKGLFTEEIEAQLQSGQIDLAVHSAKDMPTRLPDGLGLVCFPEREQVADALISERASRLDDLALGATVGSASLRRKALLLRNRPDLDVIMFRGNVDTRLRKIADGVADATLLAVAGLKRLGMADHIAGELDVSEFPPAPGQGAICIEARLDRKEIAELLSPLNHHDTACELAAERAFLDGLDGSCRTPIAGLARCEGGKLALHGMVLSPDGGEAHEGRLEGAAGDGEAMGLSLAEQLRKAAGTHFFEDW